jgi:hypothetical protein
MKYWNIWISEEEDKNKLYAILLLNYYLCLSDPLKVYKAMIFFPISLWFSIFFTLAEYIFDLKFHQYVYKCFDIITLLNFVL